LSLAFCTAMNNGTHNLTHYNNYLLTWIVLLLKDKQLLDQPLPSSSTTLVNDVAKYIMVIKCGGKVLQKGEFQ
jgi:hypothetical protein